MIDWLRIVKCGLWMLGLGVVMVLHVRFTPDFLYYQVGLQSQCGSSLQECIGLAGLAVMAATTGVLIGLFGASISHIFGDWDAFKWLAEKFPKTPKPDASDEPKRGDWQ